MSANELVYYDPSSGRLETERVYAQPLLHWLYNTALGRLARALVSTPAASRLYGWLHRRRWSRRRIEPFVRRMGIDMTESTQPLEEFESFADFFTREIDVGRRPIFPDPQACIAPVDGKVLAFQTVDPDTSFTIKRSVFSLYGLLRDPELTTRFAHGSMVICRLSLADYHHVHFPDSGKPGRAATIPGRLEAGGPYSLRSLVPFYSENHRMLTPFESDHFGSMALVEIGALTVGSIRQSFRAGVPVAKGARKGFFELGGSTVVLLFRRGAIELDAALLDMTASGIETRLAMGSAIGRAARLPSPCEVRDAGR